MQRPEIRNSEDRQVPASQVLEAGVREDGVQVAHPGDALVRKRRGDRAREPCPRSCP